ncbi:MAG TPA: glycosyltransferase [Acidimicrobiales bacterium]|nr:glycosyltransferase [Acidimicrobiales bacterium]
MRVVAAVACHRDEPGVARTVADLSDGLGQFEAARIVVCVNGLAARTSPAATALAEVPGVELRFLEQPSKAEAWNVLRREVADVTVFSDADVRITPGSVAALVEALEEHPDAVLASAAQRPSEPESPAARAASSPFKLTWQGVAGTLYAARTEWLPEMPADVILDDAWLWAAASAMGEGCIVSVPDAVATFRPASSWRDLWRQRLRAEAGKRQLRSWGVRLAPAPDAARPSWTTLRTYSPRELPAVAALAAVKLAASGWSRLRQPDWGTAPTTKS